MKNKLPVEPVKDQEKDFFGIDAAQKFITM